MTPTPTLLPERFAILKGLACRHCGSTEFVTNWQTCRNGEKHVRSDCAKCGKFHRYLPQGDAAQPAYEMQRYTPPAPPPEPESTGAHPAHRAPPATWRWVGWIRLDDGVWRPVAEASSCGKCWDALLTAPLDGDRLVYPVMPGQQQTEEARAA